MSSTTADGGSRLDWPPELERTEPAACVRTSKFDVTLTQSIANLERKMDRLGVNDWRFETAMNHQSKNPNYPYASQPQPGDPGVVLRWSMDGDQFAIACDMWTKPRDNTREIGLYVREKRKMENRPVATGQSEFATARLPPADEDAIAAPPAQHDGGLEEEPHEILGVAPNAPDDVVKAVTRRLSANVHPDGDDPDREAFKRVQRVRGRCSMSGNANSGTVSPENFELRDEEREEFRCPFCDGRIHRIGNYGECTDCGERSRKQSVGPNNPIDTRLLFVNDIIFVNSM